MYNYIFFLYNWEQITQKKKKLKWKSYSRGEITLTGVTDARTLFHSLQM